MVSSRLDCVGPADAPRQASASSCRLRGSSSVRGVVRVGFIPAAAPRRPVVFNATHAYLANGPADGWLRPLDRAEEVTDERRFAAVEQPDGFAPAFAGSEVLGRQSQVREFHGFLVRHGPV